MTAVGTTRGAEPQQLLEAGLYEEASLLSLRLALETVPEPDRARVEQTGVSFCKKLTTMDGLIAENGRNPLRVIPALEEAIVREGMQISVAAEQLASWWGPETPWGALVRHHAVSGALLAEDVLRTWALVARYIEEPIDDATRSFLIYADARAGDVYESIRRGGAVSFVSVAEKA